MEPTTFDLDAPAGELHASAAYFAVLAYPESHQKRDRAVSAIFAFLNRAARAAGRPLSPIASDLFRDVRQRAQGELLGAGRKGMLPRLYRRNLAAIAAQRMISAGESLHEIARISGYNESYFLHTVWTESKPVLHLALGLRSVLNCWRDDGRAPYVQLLARLGWVHDAMTRSEKWREMLTLGSQGRVQILPWGANGVPQPAPEFMRHIDPDTFVRLVPLDCADSPTTP